MKSKAYQCCYTNATRVEGGVTKTGWQPVAVSPDIPTTALEGCTRLQSVNSAIQGRMVDEQGNILDLLEVVGDQDYAYVMRTRYGLSDNFGRANMFSQAFVFPWSGEALADPNVFLGVCDENYKSNESDAEGAVNHLSYETPLNLDRAMQEAGISKDSYIELIRCVVARLIDKSISNPLYVQFDGSSRAMRTILYCIYAGLPYALRRRLSAASCPSIHTETKVLVFTTDARSKRLFVDPVTGANNILTNRIKGRLAIAGFYDYVAARVGAVDADTYFSSLDRKARELGDISASDPIILKLAHQLVTGFDYSSLDTESLKDVLSDALMSSGANSAAMEELLSNLLNLAVEHDLALSPMSERDLIDKLSNAMTGQLSQVGEHYLIHRFTAMGEEEAVKRLRTLSPEMRQRYLLQMLETQRGQRIIDRYYEAVVRHLEKPTWEGLRRILCGASDLDYKPATTDALDAASSQLYETLLDDLDKASQSFNSYVEFARELLPQDRWEVCERGAREAFWNHVTISVVNPDNIETYRYLSDESDKARDVGKLCVIERLLSLPDEERFLESSWGFIRSGAPSLATKDELLSHLSSSVASLYHGPDAHLKDWLRTIVHYQSPKTAKELLILRDSVQTANLSKAIEVLHNLVDAVRNGEANQQEASIAANVVLPFLCRCDERDPLSLNEWLLVGEALDANNPFGVFDKCEASILQMEPIDVVRGSKLDASAVVFSRSSFSSAAQYRSLGEAYIKNRGDKAKTIKRWLNASRKLGSTSGPNGGIASAVGGLFSRFSRMGMSPKDSDSHTTGGTRP